MAAAFCRAIAALIRAQGSVLPPFLRSDAMLAMSTRAIQGAALSLSAVLVILHLSASDQGFYFAFISFGVLLQLCDFGLSYASLQAASHLLAIGRADEIGSLAARALRINAVGTVLAVLVVAPLGAWTFADAHDPTIAWVAPWFVFIAGVAVNHLTAPAIFILEGGVSVTRAWQLRLSQEVVAGAVLLAVLAVGDGLWSLAAYYWARTVVGTWGLWRFARPLLTSDAQPGLVRWREQLWPFQWRVGVGAISSFMVFQAFGPILFALRGPAEAGRFSLSLAVMNALVMVTTAWPVSQAAHLGVMLGRRDGVALRAHWRRLVVGSLSFSATSALAAILVIAWLRYRHPDLMSRFAGPVTTSLLVATAVAHQALACFSVVLRAERHDPLMTLGIVGGVVTVALMTAAAATDVRDLVALVYAVCTGVTVIFAYRVYRGFARRRFGPVEPGATSA